jgi:hypothetical protein
MCFRIGLWAIAGLLILSPAAFAQTQNSPEAKPIPDARMDRFEQRLNEMEHKYEAELKARDHEIARLRALIEQRASTPTTATSSGHSTQDILDEIDKANGPSAAAQTQRSEAVAQRMLKNAESRSTLGLQRTPVSFNPDMAVVGDFHGNISTDNSNPARNRFDLASAELDLRAAVDPRADGVVVLPVSRDVDDPLFFRHPGEGSGAVNTGVEIEEAYIFLHDFGVPNLTAKLGKYHLRFGRQNILHSHDWPTVDNNFVNQAFLGPEAISDAGLSLSYVIPPKLIGGQYIELIAEIISGEGSGDFPVLNNDAFVHSPALNMHVLWNHDISRDWNLELGGSWLTGKHNDDDSQNVNLFGGDLTLIHTDPTGRFNNQLFQAEAIYGIVDTSRSDTQRAWGAYLLAQQQIDRDWYAGVRLDWTQNPLNDRQEVWGVSPYVSWYWSEFLRFRLEYQHKDGDVKDEDTLYFQAVFIFGAHPPHPYWAMH